MGQPLFSCRFPLNQPTEYFIIARFSWKLVGMRPAAVEECFRTCHEIHRRHKKDMGEQVQSPGLIHAEHSAMWTKPRILSSDSLAPQAQFCKWVISRTQNSFTIGEYPGRTIKNMVAFPLNHVIVLCTCPKNHHHIPCNPIPRSYSPPPHNGHKFHVEDPEPEPWSPAAGVLC